VNEGKPLPSLPRMNPLLSLLNLTAYKLPATRGLHSSNFKLNVNAFCGKGEAF